MDQRAPCESSRHRALRIIITGERLRRRHLAVVDGHPVWLPPGLFALLCRLVCYRCATQTGFACVSPLLIYRIRQFLREADDGLGGIIQTGDGQEYRVAPPAEQLAATLAVRELPVPGLISAQEQQILLRIAIPVSFEVGSSPA